MEYCNSQIAALTQDNAQLSELLERLVDLIENEPSAAEDDPLTRATSMAAKLLEGWSVGETLVEPGLKAPEVSEPLELVSEDSAAMSFDDVSDEGLDAENFDASLGEIPDLVTGAIAAAEAIDVSDAGGAIEHATEIQDTPVQDATADDTVDDDIMDAPVAADIEIPETEIAAEDDLDDILAGEIEEDTESSIRVMMARLEAAALDAKFPSEDDTAQPDPSEQVA